MRLVFKYDKKRFSLLMQDLRNKLGKEFKIYNPKICIKKKLKNKLVKKELNILGDYIFCFHEKFKDHSFVRSLSFVRGLKYTLNGFEESQLEINSFIDKCKNLENPEGYLSSSFYELNINATYKFVTGPFSNNLFKLIDLQKNKINVLLGNIKTTINKNNFIFQPV